MEKSKILNFISKYNLGGQVDSVRWNFKDNKLETKFMSPTKSLLGNILLSYVDVEDEAEIGIYETSKLQKMVSILDEVFDVKLTEASGRYRTIEFSDRFTDIKYMLSELDIIEKASELKYMPEFHLNIKLTKVILDRFIKAKGAIDISDHFFITGDVLSGSCYFTLGEGTNKIKIEVDADIEADIQGLSFDTNLFSEILVANKDFTDSELKISSEGLAYFKFTNEHFISKYYLVAKVGENE